MDFKTMNPAKHALSLLDGFKDFAFKGNVIDLAVGVIIGGAFSTIVNSLVHNIIMPLIGVVMPGDRGERWDVATAAQCARALEELGICWLEEPLRTDDAAGYASLRGLTTLRIAAGEMVRNAGEARDLVVRGQVDVLQCDVLFVGGFGGARRLAALADLHGRAWSPHTWSNGLGLVANLHAALAFSTGAEPPSPVAWNVEVRTVMTFFASFDFTVWIAFPA